MKLNIPEKIQTVLQQLESAGHEAFLVGGSVRDLLRGMEPKDWDITTSARPEEILKVFPDGKYENDFGTVILPEKYIAPTNLFALGGSAQGGQIDYSQAFASQESTNNTDKKQGTRNKEQTSSKFQETKIEMKEKNANINCEPNVEITTYRIESTYSDNRRPDEIKFAKTLEEDLGRRDFTCNAIALKVESRKSKVESSKIIDLFNGQQDIKNKVIRAVGDANERFNEDALRMMRAVRFAAQLSVGEDLEFLKKRKGEGNQNQKTEYQVLRHKKQDTSTKLQTNHNNQDTKLQTETTKIANRNQSKNKELSNKALNNSKFKIQNSSEEGWWVGERTFQAIKDNAHLLKHISPERISDEFQKIILSNRPAWGVELLVETGLMKYIIPEVLDTIGIRQNRHHYNGPYNTVYKHMLAALKTCPSKKLEVRLAAFFHDIGKPKSKRGHGYNATFYGHEYIGARMTKEIMERLKFPRKVIDKTVLLVKNHMFYYNTDEVGEKGVRKVVRKVGLENINDLIDVRIGDRLGSGVAKAVPYKLRHFKYMVEKVSHDPISVKDLKINGDILLANYNFKPGPQMGAILEILLAEVLDDPKLNSIEHLAHRAIELQKEDLQQLRQIAKNKIKQEKKEEEKQTKGKYWVK